MSLGNECAPFTMPVVPAGGQGYNSGSGMGWGGDGAWWIIILFLFVFCGWGNNGWGNGNNGGGAATQGYDTRADIQRGFDNSAVITKLDGITQGICDSTYALNNSITSGFSSAELSRCNQQAAIMQQLCNMAAQSQACCCETQRAIDGVKYQMATDTCAVQTTVQGATRDLLENQNTNTRAILDFLTQDRIAQLQSENQSLKLAASQSNQNAVIGAKIDAATAELIRRTGADCPIPAYVVQPPAQVTFPTNCCGTFNGGWGNGCNNYGGC